MPMQGKNADMVSFMATYFAELNDPGFVYPRLTGAALGLPRLRAYWPFSSVTEAGNVLDLSGQARTLTNNSATVFGTSDLRVYASPDGTADYFSRADEAGLEFTGSFTVLGWFRCTRAVGSVEYFIAKGGAGLTGYHLARAAGGVLTGTVNAKSFTTTLTPATDAWSHLAMRLTASTELSVWLNGVQQVDTTSIPANPTDTANDFTIGRQSSAASGYFQGNVCQIALCGAAVSDVLIWSHFQQTRGIFGV